MYSSGWVRNASVSSSASLCHRSSDIYPPHRGFVEFCCHVMCGMGLSELTNRNGGAPYSIRNCGSKTLKQKEKREKNSLRVMMSLCPNIRREKLN